MSKHDDKIKILLAKVEEQQSNLGTKPRANWATNAVFKDKDGGTFFNLNTVKDPQILVEALASLLTRERSIDEAGKMLGLPAKELMWNGYSVASWAKDFKTRLDMIKFEERKAQLDTTKAKLKDLRSEDARTQDQLEDIEKLL